MPRSTFDRLLDALPEISAEARDSQDIIVDHYDSHSYSTRPISLFPILQTPHRPSDRCSIRRPPHFPSTSFVKPAAPRNVPRALSLAPAKYKGNSSEYPFTYDLKRKHSSPPTSPRKRRRIPGGSRKENIVGPQSGGDDQGGIAGAGKKRTDNQDTLDLEGQAKNEGEEYERSFLERRQHLEGLLFRSH
ncbi:hypothetical protein BDZ89DRAFT_1142561 [Hymenopellis radicata]|nr:hypothetical protein BDZ89DRAFT_1142561 [Hymenopellis radicata]